MSVFAMMLGLIGTLAVGEALLMAPLDEEWKRLPDGRHARSPRVLRADRLALYLLVFAVDFVAAAAFLMWPLEVMKPGEAAFDIPVIFVPMMLLGPVTWWLLGLLDKALTTANRSDRHE